MLASSAASLVATAPAAANRTGKSSAGVVERLGRLKRHRAGTLAVPEALLPHFQLGDDERREVLKIGDFGFGGRPRHEVENRQRAGRLAVAALERQPT